MCLDKNDGVGLCSYACAYGVRGYLCPAWRPAAMWWGDVECRRKQASTAREIGVVVLGELIEAAFGAQTLAFVEKQDGARPISTPI